MPRDSRRFADVRNALYATAALCAVRSAGAQATPAWRLQLDHAIRPAEGSPGMLGKVSGVVVAPNGTVYVAEAGPARVTRYDATGKFTDVFMREGSGPGEVRRPELAIHADTLAIYDPGQLRLTRMSPAGNVISQRSLDVNASGFPIWTTRDGSVLVDAVGPALGMNQSALRVSARGRVDTVAWNANFADQQFVQWIGKAGVIKGGPFSAAPRAGVDPAGHIVVGGSRASRWVVIAGRDTVQRVTLPDHPITIPTSVRDSAWDAFMARFKSTPMADALHKELLPTVLPAWVTLEINPRGEWWIGRPGMDGRLAAWDIVADGKLVGHAAIPARVTGAATYGADLIALLHEDADGIPWIGVYRIVRASR